MENVFLKFKKNNLLLPRLSLVTNFIDRRSRSRLFTSSAAVKNWLTGWLNYESYYLTWPMQYIGGRLFIFVFAFI